MLIAGAIFYNISDSQVLQQGVEEEVNSGVFLCINPSITTPDDSVDIAPVIDRRHGDMAR